MNLTDFARRSGSLWLGPKLAVATVREGEGRYCAAWVLNRPHRLAIARTRERAIKRLLAMSPWSDSRQ